MRVSCRWTGHHLKVAIMPSGLKYQGTLFLCGTLGLILTASFFAPMDPHLRLWTGIPFVVSLGLISIWPNYLMYDRYSGGVEYWPGIWKNQKTIGLLRGAGEVHLISIDGQFDGNNSRKRRFHVLIVSQGPPIKLPPIYCFEHEAWNLADGIARAFGIPMHHATVDQIRT
ncbi:MAG: hypothetical protein K2X47_07970 [Bdellovibrionales bacterium]|nr:hypothetical protein [Bdellovibrionales bacterium]